MRRKKVVLLLDGNELRRRVRRFVLENAGFRVLSGAALPRQPGRKLAWFLARADVAVVESPLRGDALCAAVHASIPEAGILQISGGSDCAHIQIAHLAGGMADLLENVRKLAARKRGPKALRGSELLPAGWIPDPVVNAQRMMELAERRRA